MLRLENVNFFVKCLGASTITGAAWLTRHPVEAGIVAGLTLALLAATRLPQARSFYRISALIFIMVSGTWTLNFAMQGMALQPAMLESVRMAFRLIATTGSFFIVIETTSAGALLAACAAARLPGTLTLGLVLVVGMIPLIREEYQHIADTQRARGLELDKGPILTRVRYALAKGTPLIVQAFRMAEAISLTLHLYGFDTTTRRTSWREMGLVAVETQLRPIPPHQPQREAS